MNQTEFKKGYCSRSGITQEEFDKHFVVLPCKCNYEECEGWATVGNSELEIKIHNELYNQ